MISEHLKGRRPGGLVFIRDDRRQVTDSWPVLTKVACWPCLFLHGLELTLARNRAGNRIIKHPGTLIMELISYGYNSTAKSDLAYSVCKLEVCINVKEL